MVKKSKKESDNRKSISVYVSQDIYQALRKYCFDKEIAHTEFFRQLLVEKLKKEKYLKGK